MNIAFYTTLKNECKFAVWMRFAQQCWRLQIMWWMVICCRCFRGACCIHLGGSCRRISCWKIGCITQGKSRLCGSCMTPLEVRKAEQCSGRKGLTVHKTYKLHKLSVQFTNHHIYIYIHTHTHTQTHRCTCSNSVAIFPDVTDSHLLCKLNLWLS